MRHAKGLQALIPYIYCIVDVPADVTCKVLLFADDSALLVSGKDLSEIEITLR